MFTRKVMLGAAVAAGLLGSPAAGYAACAPTASPNNFRDYTCNIRTDIRVIGQTLTLINIINRAPPGAVDPGVKQQAAILLTNAVVTLNSDILGAIGLLSSRIRRA